MEQRIPYDQRRATGTHQLRLLTSLLPITANIFAEVVYLYSKTVRSSGTQLHIMVETEVLVDFAR